MFRRISELIGFVLGYPVGLLFASGSILRNARFFHPRGLLFSGEVDTSPESPFPLPPHAMIRFSSAWWKNQEWPDVLGVTIRMGRTPLRRVSAEREDQDLLFASFRRPWEIFFAPFFTEFRDFLDNSYYAISPFRLKDGRIIDLMIEPSRSQGGHGNRNEVLLGEVLGGKVFLRLMMKERDKENWFMAGKIRVIDELNLDQEALRFHPFQCVPELKPAGFLQHLRFGTYHMSQWVRPGVSSEFREELPDC